jgi:hypothetical protein
MLNSSQGGGGNLTESSHAHFEAEL